MSSNPHKKPNTLEELDRVLKCYESLTALPPTERDIYLEELRKTSTELADEVEKLVQSFPKVSQFLETPPSLPLEIFSVQKIPLHRTLNPQEPFGLFIIENKIGEGGFSTVYRAKHTQLERTIALKVFASRAKEARNLAQIDHESIIRVFSEGTDAKSSLCWVEMPLVPGLSLAEVLKFLKPGALTGNAMLETIEKNSNHTAPLDPTALSLRQRFSELNEISGPITVILTIARALAHAHSRGIVHLDVKPSNILIDFYGRPFLTDFNTSLDSNWNEAESLQFFGGTMDYMAPEQQRVFTATDKLSAIKEVSERSDVFALGIVLKECLGSVETDATLTGILHRATAPNPNDRPRSAAMLARELEGYLKLSEIQRQWGNQRGLFSRHPLMTLTLAGAIPQLVASVIGTSYNQLRVVASLSPEQQQFFSVLNQSVTPAIYLIASLFWLGLCLRLTPALAQALRGNLSESATHQLRKRILALPWWGMAVTTFSWVLSSIIFPSFMAYKTGGLSSQTIYHFGVSFLLSWLISLSFTFLLHQYCLLRFLYPRLLHPASSLTLSARVELKYYPIAMRIAVLLTLLVPNAGAVLLLAGDLSGAIGLLRILLLSLLVSGVFGALGAAALGLKISRYLNALR